MTLAIDLLTEDCFRGILEIAAQIGARNDDKNTESGQWNCRRAGEINRRKGSILSSTVVHSEDSSSYSVPPHMLPHE
jgi:hypothetical protein